MIIALVGAFNEPVGAYTTLPMDRLQLYSRLRSSRLQRRAMGRGDGGRIIGTQTSQPHYSASLSLLPHTALLPIQILRTLAPAVTTGASACSIAHQASARGWIVSFYKYSTSILKKVTYIINSLTIGQQAEQERR